MPQSLAREPENETLIDLNEAKVGCNFRIRYLSGPSCEQLRSLGVCESMQIRKLAGGRNLLCSICGTRLALSRELASQVMVSCA